MFICGNSLIGGSNACCLSPTGVSDITYVELSNGLYDTLYITKDINLDADSQYPTDWDFDTILYAKFNLNEQRDLKNALIFKKYIKLDNSKEDEYIIIKANDIKSKFYFSIFDFYRLD